MNERNIVRTRSGVDLFVRDWGSGPPVLLLAGWGMTSDLWASVMLRLCEAELRAIAFDRRGHGRSSDPGIISYDLLADDLADVMKALDLAACTVVAHSGAGGEVVRYLARHGDTRIARIVFVGATLPALARTPNNPEGIDPALLEAIAQQIGDDLPAWIDNNARPFVAPDTPERTIDWLAGMVMGCSRRILVDYYRAMAAADFRSELRRLIQPVTIIQGDQDVSAPEALCGRPLAALLPGAEFLLYKGVAHGPMVTHVERIAADIAERAVR
ncbi:alpha/beta fold hydrolase [Lichenihabitans psoromatis]|uniref:alpha/beta fold hydrolase n=1 Tax=Lichenihabitans psoromatis TaxID=2528642 RepID=UPI0013F15FD2|nr:alpha/beta hydrolase [Lichenihabitans psoromatis]